LRPRRAAQRILAIELVVASQAIELRGPPALGGATRTVFELVRERVPFCGEGDPIPADLEGVRELIRSVGLS
jgi:histidine ammonia-lyase